MDEDEDDPHRSEAQQKRSWKQFLFSSRRSRRRTPPAPPVEEIGLEGHNMTNALLGAMLVWFGWFGFNAGSELRANSRAASTFIASNLAASSGGITFTLIEQYVVRDKWSGVGFCTGAFAGLVAITPGAGWVSYFDFFHILFLLLTGLGSCLGWIDIRIYGIHRLLRVDGHQTLEKISRGAPRHINHPWSRRSLGYVSDWYIRRVSSQG